MSTPNAQPSPSKLPDHPNNESSEIKPSQHAAVGTAVSGGFLDKHGDKIIDAVAELIVWMLVLEFAKPLRDAVCSKLNSHSSAKFNVNVGTASMTLETSLPPQGNEENKQ